MRCSYGQYYPTCHYDICVLGTVYEGFEFTKVYRNFRAAERAFNNLIETVGREEYYTNGLPHYVKEVYLRYVGDIGEEHRFTRKECIDIIAKYDARAAERAQTVSESEA